MARDDEAVLPDEGSPVDETAPGDPVVPPAEAAPLYSVINARNRASITLHEKLGFVEAARGHTFAGITFTGGVGVLMSVTAGFNSACLSES
ncbi:MAG: hypothetical protein ACTHW1_06830 [Ancrocorticia sp.]|uniref:hypothetical protein n=1 Tax=Ancrocorticia sp. TaxID=2593684 RepID=UPI003F8DFBD1